MTIVFAAASTGELRALNLATDGYAYVSCRIAIHHNSDDNNLIHIDEVASGTSCPVTVGASEGAGEGEICTIGPFHTADQGGDNNINLSKLRRVIQLFNSAGFGRAPEDPDQDCCPHLSELFRFIQFYNSGGYLFCPLANPPTEDGCCPGTL